MTYGTLDPLAVLVLLAASVVACAVTLGPALITARRHHAVTRDQHDFTTDHGSRIRVGLNERDRRR